jgi:hypothetical protein
LGRPLIMTTVTNAFVEAGGLGFQVGSGLT